MLLHANCNLSVPYHHTVVRRHFCSPSSHTFRWWLVAFKPIIISQGRAWKHMGMSPASWSQTEVSKVMSSCYGAEEVLGLGCRVLSLTLKPGHCLLSSARCHKVKGM